MKKYVDARGLHLGVDTEVYTPREDSFLMIDLMYQSGYTSKFWCEIGPGTGIVSLSLTDGQSSIIAIDINHKAALQTAENVRINRLNNIMVITSDRVMPIRKNGLPENIIFNPPYLPENPEIDPYSPTHELQQLVGGKNGDETLSELLDSLLDGNHTLYTIISSLSTNPVEFAKKHENWILSVMGSENMGFETIWVLKMERTK